MKLADFFKGNRRLIPAIGLLIVVLTGGVLLTGCNNVDGENGVLAGWGIDLLEYKSPYIGDASNVSNLLTALPFGEYKRGILLDTEKEPYGLAVNYDLTQIKEPDRKFISEVFIRNSVIMFSLIDNLDTIRYNLQMGNSSYNYEYTRSVLQIYFDHDLREYAKDKEDFATLFSSFKTDDWKHSAISNYLVNAGVELNNIEEVRIEYFENDNFEKVQTVNDDLIRKLINDLNKLELLPASQMSTIRDLSNGVYIVLNSGAEDNYFYIDYTTGGISKHMPIMSSFPMYIYRFQNTEELKSVIDLFLSSDGNSTGG